MTYLLWSLLWLLVGFIAKKNALLGNKMPQVSNPFTCTHLRISQ